MAATEPFYPIATASVSWTDGAGVHLRVYASDGYTVRERCYDDGTWTDGGFVQLGNAVSATSWTDANGLHIRVYCTAKNVTTEWCADPGSDWYQGAYTTN